LSYKTKIVRVLNQTSVEEMVTLPNVVIPSSVINLYIYFGISFTIGVILFGFLSVNRNSECRINGQYLCLTSMILIVLLLVASIYLNDYYSYVIFVIAYGIAIGAFHYTNKMLVFSQVKTKAFGKAWSYVQCGQSFAILIGIPITG
jgi:predicted MFS family arabinose efflux permease